MNHSSTILIKNSRVIDPSLKRDEMADILIENGKISFIGRGEPPLTSSEYSVLDATGFIACPGFIDLHCHLRQPGFEKAETIATGTRAAARGGFTTVCCMPNTRPPLDTDKLILYVKSIAEKEGTVRVLPIGCVTRGREGLELAELGRMASAGAVAFSDDGNAVSTTELMRQALEYSVQSGLPVIDHCEDALLTVNSQINEGMISAKTGLKGWPAVAEENIVERDIALAESTGGRLHIAHVSSTGSVVLIRQAKEKGIKVTSEVTPHHLILSEEDVAGLNTNAKVNPPLRSRSDIQALINGLKDGVIDAIATDHAPHTEESKMSDFRQAPFGISGLETAFGCLMSLVHNGQIDIQLLISKLTTAPADIIGRKYGVLGSLGIGNSADLVLIDVDKEWVVDIGDFASKGKNTPLAGKTLKGRVMATFSRGKLVYKDEALS